MNEYWCIGWHAYEPMCSWYYSADDWIIIFIVAVVQLLRCVWLFAAPWTTAFQFFLSFTISRSSLKLMSIELLMPSKHLILCHPLLLLPSIFPNVRVFSNELALCIRWSKYWSFASALVVSMNIHDWFPLGLTGLISLQPKGLLSECENEWVMSDSLWPHGLYSPWNSPGQNTGVGGLSLLQGSSQPRDWTQVSHIVGINSLVLSLFYSPTLTSYWTTGLTCLLEKQSLWLEELLLVNQYLCFLICCLGMSLLCFQGASIF